MRRLALGVAAVVIVGSQLSPVGSAAPDVTFTRDVAPILHAKCVTCHRAGEVAPMALLSYQDARPYARAIKEKVASRCRRGSPIPRSDERSEPVARGLAEPVARGFSRAIRARRRTRHPRWR
jgi:hypothetical protein